jgi:ABC-type uncharacterized transport system permease subunit
MAFTGVEVLIALLFYGTATHAGWRHHAAAAPYPRVVLLAAFGLLVHAILVVHMMLARGTMVIGFGTALSLFAWQTALLLWLISLRSSTGALGFVVYPLAGACAVIGLLIPDPNGPREPLDVPAQLHIVISMVAYGLLTLGAIQAIVLSLQHRQLRQRPPLKPLATLPPLQTMETLLFRLLGAGLVLLTLAIATGAVFINHLVEQHLTHKLVLSIIAWLIFAILLVGRWRYGWRGRVASRGVLIGYAVLVLAYFGSKLVLELILGEHW